MRILILVHGYPPTFTGGAELRAERTARALAARNHQVAVLCIESLSTPTTMLAGPEHPEQGVHVYRLHVQAGLAANQGYWSDFRRLVTETLDRLVREWRPELIHLFSGYLLGSGVIDFAAERRLPIVVSLTDYWWLCHRINLIRTNGERCDGPAAVECARCANELYRRFRLPANAVPPLANALWSLAGEVPALAGPLGVHDQAEQLRMKITALNRADALIAPSHFLAQTYIRHGGNPARIKIWRQGVNMSLCPLRTSSSELRFRYFGQIKHHKGVHTLIKAWGQLGGLHARNLRLYGSDRGEESYGARLREQSHRLSNLSWCQPVSHAEVWQTLAQTDVLVIPSRWNENSPNVILEAQAMGVPVIGTNLGGIAELVRHGENGLLFAPDDADDLATQMQRLLDEPGLLASLRQHPIPFHSFADELDRIEDLYMSLTAQLPTREAPDEIDLVVDGRL
jgi:glycosyltransferase involved in cell wall biosynthesis